MQFKKQGGRVQVLAYRGYDKEKRRAIVKMMGSYDVYSYKPSDGLIDSLTDDEKQELQSHIEKARQSANKETRQYNAKYVASRIAEASDTIRAGDFEPSEAWASEVWAALDALAKAMRKAGHPKPRKTKAADMVPVNQGMLPLDGPGPVQ